MSFSKEYLEQLTALHSRSKFGSGEGIPSVVVDILKNKDVTSILDFGSGKGYTSQAIAEQFPDVKLHTYDPVTSPIKLPNSVDMIYSSDVLEHVEADLIDETLADLFTRASKYQYHLIACHPAKKKLNDGRNAHLIIETPKWWKKKLATFGWTIEHENITERYIENLGINVVKYITVLKK